MDFYYYYYNRYDMLSPLLFLLPPLFFLFLVPLVRSISTSSSSSKRQLPPLPPGPRGWPILGNLPQLGTKPHHTLASLAQSFGPLFHLHLGSVPVVVASSSTVASLFLKTHDSNFSNRPPNSGAEHVAYNYQDLVFAPYGQRWRLLRKLCSLHLFSAKALDSFRHVREQEASLLVAALAAGGAANLGEAVNVCATNALARAVMGRRVFGGGEGCEAEEFKEMVVELMRLAGVFNVGDFVPWLGWMDLQGVVGNMKRLHKRYDVFLDRLIAEHGVAGSDLVSVLLGIKEGEDADGEGGTGTVTHTEIKALLLNLFTAGTDTTSSTVEWALAELIRHPDLLKAAQAELDAVVDRSRLVSDSDLPNLPFLQAIVKETFRLHPSTPLSLPRVASESCVIQGFGIPKNATLLVNVWAIGRDPAVWPDPLEFRPGRFLSGGGHEHVDVRGNDFEVIPFGSGRRICAGMSLGLRMVQFMIATLVHAFDWSLPDGVTPEKLSMEEAYGLTLQRSEPLMVKPVPRLMKAAYKTASTESN